MNPAPDFARLLNQHRYDDAMPPIEQALRAGAADSPERFLEVARAVVAWRGFFGRSSEARESEPYFRWVLAMLQELAGPDSPAAMAAAENLASLLGSIDLVEEAIALREKVFAHARGRFPADDPRFAAVRDGLAFLYRRAGQVERADELYRDLGLCPHLEAAARFLQDAGAKVSLLGQPWSDNCHLWAYFDVVLECEALMERIAFDPCVEIHDHRGTHDGSERGLVCKVHHDAVMGIHPADAGPGRRRIP